MGFIKNIFGKKNDGPENIGGMEDFMTLIRVYFQAEIAGGIGITNINMLPDLATFKRGLKIQTQGNKLGVAEKARCKKMMEQMYGLTDSFFKEIDTSIRKNCRNVNMVQPFMFQFQGFSGDLLMQVGTILKWKFRVPSFLKNALHTMTEDAVHKIMTSNSWKDEASYKTVFAIRQYQQHLGFTESWMTEYSFNMMMLAKKEPKKKEDLEAAREMLKNR
ncbi:MAG: hypothetical protein MJY96_07750 [Bacteroidaceae bacterium]|nr:hypothetical protein [Candidatus Colenecus caballi]MCQ2073000.1 hypothetical protein [Bacteroidaceae bacterium]